MSLQQWVAVVAAIVLGLVMLLQVLLAAGFPLGQAAWRGKHRVLPRALRWASLATVGVIGLAAWIVLARAGLVGPTARPVAVGLATWVFAGFFSLNAVGNVASRAVRRRPARGRVSAE